MSSQKIPKGSRKKSLWVAQCKSPYHIHVALWIRKKIEEKHKKKIDGLLLSEISVEFWHWRYGPEFFMGGKYWLISDDERHNLILEWVDQFGDKYFQGGWVACMTH